MKKGPAVVPLTFLPLFNFPKFGGKSAVKMGDYNQGIGLTDMYPVVFSLPVLHLCGIVPNFAVTRQHFIS